MREAVTLFGLQASDLVARSWQLFTVSYFSASVFAQSALTSAEFRSLEQQSCGNLATAHVVPAASTQGISSTYMTDGFSDLKALANVNFASTSISTSKVCGIDTSFSSVSLSLPPTSPGNEIGSEVTRDEPTVEVLCEDGKFYHLLVIDGGDNGTPSASHAQLVRINAACDADGTATVSGGDTLAGTSDSFTYSAPAPTAATSRKFVWFVWETTEQVSPSTDDIDALLAANTANTFTIAAFRAALSLNGVAPYATSWANVRTELYSAYTLASDSATADQVPQVCRTLASRVGDAATAFGLADFVADGVSSLSQLVDVVFPAQGQDNDIGELCGDTSARLPAVSSLRLDPLSNSRSAQTPGATLYTTLDTRGQPSVTFGCASGDQYALLLFDPYAVPSQNGFLHWAVINIPCTAGTASADDGETYGGDTADGFPYFPPANFGEYLRGRCPGQSFPTAHRDSRQFLQSKTPTSTLSWCSANQMARPSHPMPPKLRSSERLTMRAPSTSRPSYRSSDSVGLSRARGYRCARRRGARTRLPRAARRLPPTSRRHAQTLRCRTPTRCRPSAIKSLRRE